MVRDDGLYAQRPKRNRRALTHFLSELAQANQRLHADVRDWESSTASPFSAFHDPSGRISIRDLPCPYICVNFLPQALTRLNGPTRQIPGTQNSRARIPGLSSEPELTHASPRSGKPVGA